MKFAICKIDNDYIKNLNEIDSRVQYHHGNYEKPYLGILLKVDGMDYFVPLSSAKPKHKNFNENIAFIKVNDKGHLLSVLNLNNMIPVPKSCVIDFNFNEIENKKYGALLKKEYAICRMKRSLIMSNANKLHYIMTAEPEKHPKLVSFCVDFKKLERFCQSYDLTQSKIPKPKNKFEERLQEAERNNSNSYDATEQRKSRNI